MEQFSIQDIVAVQRSSEAQELESCNETSRQYGLSLSATQIARLIEERVLALKHTERIEFGPSILKDLMGVFCSSPYILQGDYEDTLARLQEIFYQCKSDFCEEIPDDELLGTMKTLFDGTAHGSLDYLVELLEQRSFPSAWLAPSEEEVDVYVSVQDEYEVSEKRETPACYGDDWLDDIGARGWDGEVWVDDIW